MGPRIWSEKYTYLEFETVRFIRMRKQIHDCNTAVMEVYCSDIRSDLNDQEAERCGVMPYKIYGVPTNRAY